MAKQSKAIVPQYALVPVGEFVEAPINPNRMSATMFNRLVKNLKKDKALTSAVLAIKKGDKMMVISGHHRIKAAKKAGIREIPTLYLEEGSIDDSKRVALQISHNALNGTSDPAILAELAAELAEKDIEYSGVRFELDGIEPPQVEGAVTEEVWDYKHVVLCLRPETLERFRKFLGGPADMLKEDESYLISGEDWEQLKALLKEARGHGWKTPGRAFGSLLERLDGVMRDE